MFFLRGDTMKNKKGFTLIELIVVIAILGILSLFLVPSFMGYAKDAKIQVAKSNTRTVWSAASAVMIQNSYDDKTDSETFKNKVLEKLGVGFNGFIEVFVDGDTEKLNVTYQTDKYTCDTQDGVNINCSDKDPSIGD